MRKGAFLTHFIGFWLMVIPSAAVTAEPFHEPDETAKSGPAAQKPSARTKNVLTETEGSNSRRDGSEDVQVLESVEVSGSHFDDTAQTTLSTSTTVLEGSELRQKIGPTIGATLSQEPGVNNQSFGPGVGQPVIRGLSGPRVRVMENGIGNNDVANISPDHANSIEPSQAERVEVLRGPSTLLYGSGAMGGVANIIDNRVPEKMPTRIVGGVLNQTYNSALDQTSSSLKLEGGQSDLAFHLDGFYRNSGNEVIGGSAIDEQAARATNPADSSLAYIQNTNGYVANTNGRASGGAAGLSWIGEAGFAGAAINYLQNNYGIPPDGNPAEAPIRINLWQTKYDFRSGLDHPLPFAEQLRYKFGYTDYKHDELQGGLLNATWLSSSYESRIELVHEPLGPFKGQWGFQSVNGTVQALGSEAILPKSTMANYGVFAIERLETSPIRYEFGLRVEPQTVTPTPLSGYFARSFVPVSSSASALWQADSANDVTLAITESQRGPQAQELYINGIHEATRAYEIGDPNLNIESSYNLETRWSFRQDWVTSQLNLFHNWYNGYIYNQYTGEERSGLPVTQVSQGNAIFKGFEANLMFPILENRFGLVDLSLFSDYTRGTLINSGNGNVPRMPPLRYGLQLDHTLNKWSSYLRVTRGQAQNYAGQNETVTSGWVLMNVGIQYQAKQLDLVELLFFLKGNNLLDENIRNSTSYLKSYAPEPGRGVEVGFRLSY